MSDNKPVNLLALDGGGVRGISELRILQIIMDRLKARLGLPDDADDLLPCEYFQLIGGTSTGGLIAIMLGRLRMTAVEAAEQYNDLAKKIFGPQNKKYRVQDGSFKATTLKEAVEKLVASRAKMYDTGTSMIPTRNRRAVNTKCFVCALEASNTRFPELLRSYPATGRDAIKCEIWEAARATSAAPTFFKEIAIKISGGTTLRFVDGGLKCNNPINIVIGEAEVVFGAKQRVGCIVSLGCGLKSAIEVKKPSGYQKILPVNLLKALGDIATDCQETADSTAKHFRRMPNIYFRLNATDIGDLSLAEWEPMDEIVSHTRSYCRDPGLSASIDQLVEILYASRGEAGEGEREALTLGQILNVPSEIYVNESSLYGNSRPKAMKRSGPLFLVPSPKDPHFTGRENIMDLIKTKFESERRVALTGIGGVGKSQIAIEYCHRSRRDHPAWNILWIYASNTGRFEQSFHEIARKLGLSGWDDPAINTLEIVSDWLNGPEPWLMVIDNADSQDVFFPLKSESTGTGKIPPMHKTVTPLAHYLPQTSSRGSILITSRARDAAYCLTNSDSSIIDVPFMGKADAMALLCHKMKEMHEPDDRSSDAEKTELVERLDCLPLAITQAASYVIVRKRTMTISKYLEHLKKNEKILLERVPNSRRDPAFPNSVLLTWQISFNQINQDNQLAAELLSLMSVLDRQGVPRFLLQEDNEDDLDFEKRLDPLIAFSLISLDEDAQNFQMHRLVQVGVQSGLERNKTLDHFKQRSLQVIAMNFPETRWRSWETWEILQPHAQTALSYASSDHRIQLLHAQILRETSGYFDVCGKYDLAVERCKRAFNICLDLLGDGDDRTADCLCYLGRFERALARSITGNVSPSNGTRETMLRSMVRKLHGEFAVGNVYLELAKNLIYSQDERKTNEGIEILESIVDSERGKGAVKKDLNYEYKSESMDTLARAYQRRGRIAEAAAIRQKILSADLEKYGENDPMASITMDSMAKTLLKMKKEKEAYGFSKRCLDLRTKVHGKEHFETLSAMCRLADILCHWAYTDEKKHEEAYEFCRHAMNIHTRVLGDEHEQTMFCIRIFSTVLVDQNRYDEAENLIRRLINLETVVYGQEDSRTTDDMMELAEVLYDRGSYGKAEEVLRKLFVLNSAEWSDRRKNRLFRMFAKILKRLGQHEELIKIERLRIPVQIELATKAPSRRHSWPSLDALLSKKDEHEEDEEDEEDSEEDEEDNELHEDEDSRHQRPNSCPPIL